jgi:hypothetical protein
MRHPLVEPAFFACLMIGGARRKEVEDEDEDEATEDGSNSQYKRSQDGSRGWNGTFNSSRERLGFIVSWR